MSRVLCVAPAVEHDEAARVTRWIADRTRDRLAREHTVRSIVDTEASRGRMEGALNDEVDGLALFGHGCADAFLGAHKEPLLDAANAHLVASRWLHVVACECGQALARHAVEAGASCAAAYTSRLIVEWDPEQLPVEIEDAFVALVTRATELLAEGEYDQKRIRLELDGIALPIILWCDQNHEDSRVFGIQISAEQFVKALVVVAA